jgi:hypothetical protein
MTEMPQFSILEPVDDRFSFFRVITHDLDEDERRK